MEAKASVNPDQSAAALYVNGNLVFVYTQMLDVTFYSDVPNPDGVPASRPAEAIEIYPIEKDDQFVLPDVTPGHKRMTKAEFIKILTDTDAEYQAWAAVRNAAMMAKKAQDAIDKEAAMVADGERLTALVAKPSEQWSQAEYVTALKAVILATGMTKAPAPVDVAADVAVSADTIKPQ